MARHGFGGGYLLRGAFVVALLATAWPLGLGGAPLSPQTSSSDVAAQIDELIKQVNEQMNVKGQFARAAELAQQAADIALKAGDKSRASTAMVYLGAAYSYQGRLAEALDVSQRNLTLARETGNTRNLEDALNTLAGVLGESGRYEESLGYLYECLELARTAGDATMRYTSLLNIGEAYVRSGDPEQAEAPLRESLRAARELKPAASGGNPAKKGTEMALLDLGSMELARGRYREALTYYQRVHASRPESPLWFITALAGMSEAHELLGEPRQAIELLQDAIPLAEKSSNGLQSARLLGHLGANQEALGQAAEALTSEERALALIHESGGNPDYEWQVESRIGHVHRTLGHTGEALDHYRRSIDGIERLRLVALNTEEGRAGVLSKSRDTYAETADLLYELHLEDQALAFAERGRARAFLDVLAESRVGLADELTPDQRAREDAILARISATQKDLLNDRAGEERKRFETVLTAAERDLEAFHVEIRRRNPRYSSVRYPEPASLEDIQRALVGDGTALVEYLLGETRSLAWVITKDKLVSVVLPPKKQIEDGVHQYRRLLRTPVSALTLNDSIARIAQAGARIHRQILRPVQASIASATKLVIVPDGALAYLPFEALVTGSRSLGGETRPSYLVEKASVVYGPSASALIAVQTVNRRSAAPAKMLLAFGDPIARESTGQAPSAPQAYAERGFSLQRLPYTRDEVLAIGHLFPAAQRDMFLGLDAREDTVKRAKLEDYRFIHFASHGFLDETRPGRSGILFSRARQLADDGILQMGEIMRLKMNADLVTLSACSTGLGKLVNGEGMLGLTRAMFYAGARNVAVSLWNVNDSATARLMESFYGGLNKGLSEHEAMRRAKLSLLRGAQATWRHPYFWAPFVIEGEGR